MRHYHHQLLLQCDIRGEGSSLLFKSLTKVCLGAFHTYEIFLKLKEKFRNRRILGGGEPQLAFSDFSSFL